MSSVRVDAAHEASTQSAGGVISIAREYKGDAARLLAEAMRLHCQGSLSEAEALYRELLATEPDHPEALHLLGVMAMAAGNADKGIGLMEHSLQAKPAQMQVLLDLARALTQVRRHEAALEACDQALVFEPDCVAALHERGNTLMRLHRPESALDCYDRLLVIDPVHAGGWNNRGNALEELGRLAEAIASFERAIAQQPSFAVAYNNRGNALRKLERYEEALASYEQATHVNPRLAGAHNNCGITLSILKRTEEALAAFERAVALKPAFVDALVNRGNSLRDSARPAAALESYERALAVDPNCAEALSNRGNALLDLKCYTGALESYDAALRGMPDHPDILANRATALLELARYGDAASDLERLLQVSPQYDYALGNLLQARLHTCDWREYSQRTQQVVAALEAGQRVVHPFCMMNVSASAAGQLHAATLHAPSRVARSPSHEASRAGRSRDKLRIAYLSADLREHAVSYLLAGVFEQHAREQFEIIAISLLPPEASEMGNRVQRAFDRFVDVSRHTDREIAVALRGLEIDIAVDLMGYTHKARPGVFAHEAVPVQVNYLGYPGTLGARFIHYILADEFVIPREAARHYAEQVVYLPESFQANDDRCVIGVRPTRAQAGLPEQGLVFCCFNSNYKLNPPMFDIWMRLLRAVPGSVLWLLGDRDDTRENLCREAAQRGVEPRRLVFAGRLPYAQHLGRLGLADLFLDTLPYNAGTTASDALRTGVPVLTCAGEAFAARMAGSLLTSLGLPELITYSLEDYERSAIGLGQQREQLESIRARLAGKRTRALFDTGRHCRHLEAAYLQMHERAMRGEAPSGFTVSPPEMTARDG